MSGAIRLAALVSGGGTTAFSILNQTLEGGQLHGLFEIPCLIASKPGIGAIEKFEGVGFTGNIYVREPSGYAGPFGFADELVKIMSYEKIELFGQYGWLPMTPAGVIKRFKGINQHPAPVPHFGGQGMYGLAPHQAIINFARMVDRPIMTAATAQVVDEQYDLGHILAEVPLPVNPEWSAEELQKELLSLEWLCQMHALLRVSAYRNGFPPAVKSVFTLLPGEEEILAKAKAEAIRQYPRG